MSVLNKTVSELRDEAMKLLEANVQALDKGLWLGIRQYYSELYGNKPSEYVVSAQSPSDELRAKLKALQI
jgi:hypothetical protein